MNQTSQNCPRCTSNSTTPSTRGKYKCNACGNDFYTAFQSGAPSSGQTWQSSGGKRSRNAWFGWVVFLLLFTGGLPAFIFTVIERNLGDGESLIDNIASINDQWHRDNLWFYSTEQGGPIVIMAGQKGLYDSDSDRVDVGFFNAQTREALNVESVAVNDAYSQATFRTFENNNIYLVLDSSKVYFIDQSSAALVDATDSLFEPYSELSSGVAKVEFVPEHQGDGFKVTANSGDKFRVYPLIETVFNEDEMYQVDSGFDTVPVDTPVRTLFEFTSESVFYDQEKHYLLKIDHKNAVGYPRSSFSWSNDSPDEPVTTMWGEDEGRIISFVDFTPGRVYFDSRVLLVTSDEVLIHYKETPADNASQILESLDAETGEVLWSMNVDDTFEINEFDTRMFRYDDGYFIKAYSKGWLLKQGGLVEVFDL